MKSKKSPQSLWLDLWLEEQESSHRFVLFEADYKWSHWTQKCIREADVVLLVGWSDADVALSEAERQIRATANPIANPRQELVLLHPKEAKMPSGRGSTKKRKPKHPLIVPEDRDVESPIRPVWRHSPLCVCHARRRSV